MLEVSHLRKFNRKIALCKVLLSLFLSNVSDVCMHEWGVLGALWFI